jgi:hypothetical protein
MNMQHHNRTFSIAPAVIWVSSVCIGVLASIPKLLRLNLQATELGVDISIAGFFSVFVWYYNLYHLPNYRSNPAPTRFAGKRLWCSLLLGMVVMSLLVMVHQLIFPQYHFLSMMLMYQFRALVINLTIYLFIHLLYQGYITRTISIELEQLKADKLSAQFELLKQQVNPHFLFNSLNTLKSMVEIQDKQATDFIVKLSDFYRFSLEHKKESLVSLAEETAMLQSYMYLLKARFEEGIHLDINLDEVYRQSFIPVFTLQLLVENCIKHNVVSLSQPLHIRLYAANGYIVLENNLQPKRSAERSTHTGLENISTRYLLLVQQKPEVTRGDAFFTVKLPVIYENSYR